MRVPHACAFLSARVFDLFVRPFTPFNLQLTIIPKER
jgi:hypothetical protein